MLDPGVGEHDSITAEPIGTRMSPKRWVEVDVRPKAPTGWRPLNVPDAEAVGSVLLETSYRKMPLPPPPDPTLDAPLMQMKPVPMNPGDAATVSELVPAVESCAKVTVEEFVLVEAPA